MPCPAEAIIETPSKERPNGIRFTWQGIGTIAVSAPPGCPWDTSYMRAWDLGCQGIFGVLFGAVLVKCALHAATRGRGRYRRLR